MAIRNFSPSLIRISDMQEQKARIKVQGQIKHGRLVPIQESTERWTELRLEDGTTIRMKPVATRVVRLPRQYDGNGSPIYVVQSTNVLDVAAPEHLCHLDDATSTEVH